MDTELVTRAQRGDEEAFASLAVAAGDRLHAVAHRILRDIDLAEDATQQALLSIWRDLPQLRDPARFDAWSYRLLVRACYAEGRRTRRWTPNLRLLPADEPAASEGLELGRRSRPARARLPTAFHRPSRGGGPPPLPRPAARRGRRRRSASPSGRSDPDYITRCAACARRSTPTPGRRRGRLRDEHRSRRHPHRSVVAGRGRHGAPGPRPGRRARPSPRDPTAPCLVAGAEVRRHEQSCQVR